MGCSVQHAQNPLEHAAVGSGREITGPTFGCNPLVLISQLFASSHSIRETIGWSAPYGNSLEVYAFMFRRLNTKTLQFAS